ncbi:RNA polymerase sigma factor [Polluticoccus soli]|uniref:RNA polymerase sigma factor n=1 Tax=Polluticoccus soli TaxID=3034150 RepID=UPI0023E1B529|nr:sigma-70 family RNA polymerase sigma factor [Flavipsychrobacter sp. JY13-12]
MQTAITYTEEELVSLLKQQSKEAYNYLYRQYSAVLFGVIKRIVMDEQTAQDVLQEVFVKIWNNIQQYDPVKGRIYTWMINIARNSSIDKLRSKGEVMKGKIRGDEETVNNIGGGLQTEQNTDAIGLKKLVDELKPEHKAIVELAYFKGYTMEEIGKALDIPVGTVKTRMRNAIQTLRQQFSR